MAKNTGKGSRRGAVKNRSEFKHANGTYMKRDAQTGRITNASKNPIMASATRSNPGRPLGGTCQPAGHEVVAVRCDF